MALAVPANATLHLSRQDPNAAAGTSAAIGYSFRHTHAFVCQRGQDSQMRLCVGSRIRFGKEYLLAMKKVDCTTFKNVTMVTR